jgi:hypothetical protein
LEDIAVFVREALGDELPAVRGLQGIGHSIQASGRHYTKGVSDELFEKAAKGQTHT